jgi:hypothetical protein
VRSTGIRGLEDELTAEGALRVREYVADWAGQHDVGKLTLGAIYAVAENPLTDAASAGEQAAGDTSA